METLAAVLITSLIVTFALGAYVQVADTAEGATQRLRDDLHATTILDRMTEDLQAAMLVVKPEEQDPLSHPWYFVAESREAFSGSDAIRFISRRSRSYRPDAHDSDFAEVAFQVTTDEDGLQTLYRWLRPGLPERYDPGFPLIDDERSHVLGEGLSGFHMRFLDAEGEWVDTWDSTQLVQSSTLPVAVEISFDMGEPTGDEGFDEATYVRRVVLPMQPLDLEGMIADAKDALAGLAGGDDGDGGDDAGDDDEVARLLQCIQNACVSQGFSGTVCATVNAMGTNVTAAQLAPYAAQAGCN
jgi:hypothetical protein